MVLRQVAIMTLVGVLAGVAGACTMEEQMRLLVIGGLASLLLCTAVADGRIQRDVKAPLIDAGLRPSAPSFRLSDGKGTTIELSKFRGRPVVLNLWATECGGCRAELPTFVELRRNYNAHDLEVIGVSMEVMYESLKTATEGWARVRPFVQSHGLQYTIVMDDGSVEKNYHVTAMPSTYVIDKRGRVAATYVGVVDAADLMANVKAVVAERE